MSKFFCIAMGLAMVWVSSTTAFAAESIRLKDALGNKKFEEDKRITDIELKAQAGSLSRYSLKFDLSYSGPAVDDLGNPEMPNPDNRPRNNRTSLGGFMGLRYRTSSAGALNLSTGLKWYSPIHQMAGEYVNKPPGQKDQEISDPRISYDHTYVVGETQMRSSVKGSVTTADFFADRGQNGSVGLTQGVKYTVGQSRWILGAVADLDFYFFNRPYDARTDGKTSNYVLSLIPSLEYKLTDSLNIKTSIGYTYSALRRDDDWTMWDQAMANQRLGVGWAITRAVYFNPYISFFTEKPSIKTTSASFSTVFSIF